MFSYMPIYRCLDCRKLQVDSPAHKDIFLWELNLNQIIFVFINWVELAVLYFVYRGLKAQKQTPFNIKWEVFVAILSWVTGSLFYLYMNTPLVFDPTGTGNDYSRFGNFGIQMRNILTFFATTLFTLYSVYSGKTQVENFQD
jgi:hypothetical protein